MSFTDTNGLYQLKDKTPLRPYRLSLTESQPTHLNKTLSKLIDRFQLTETQKHRLLEKFSQLLLNQREPSIPENELAISTTLQKNIQETQGSEEAFRFSHLYNKLASRQRPCKKWSILYLLSLLSETPTTQRSLFIRRQSLHTPTTRPYEEEEILHRNTRRRLTLESEIADTTTLPIAEQLARARQQREVPETDLIRDLIYLFQGINGHYIRYDPRTSEYIFASGTYIPQPVKSIVFKLSETGWLYSKVQDFVQSDEGVSGLIGQSLRATFQEELKEYYKWIAQLEAQLEKQLTNEKDQVTDQTLTLKRLLVWALDTNQKLNLMNVLIDACHDQKGGALISTIHNYTKHGDPFIKSYLVSILQSVSRPFYDILERWIYEGELDDPYDEFFVACDNTVSRDELWQKKYTLREDMLPSFLTSDVALKIYSIGKSLNFIRYSCHEEHNIYTVYDRPTFRYGDTELLEASIESAYKETSKYLLNLLQSKYKLMSHLKAVKRYLLLGQGDFIQYLMDHLWDTLGKPANTLFRHNLTTILETAVRQSNAQYDDPDILERLDVQLLEVQHNDMGWDVFSLEYHVDTPINTVFNTAAMHNYLKVFHFLWRLKRVEYTLSSAWRQWGKVNRKFLGILDLQQDIQYAQLTIQRMIHFIYQLQHYVLFEVLECSWDKLETLVNKSVDLDSLIEAHAKYLSEITEKGFLSGEGENEVIANRLHHIFECILNYKVLLDHLHNYATNRAIGRDSSYNKLERIRRLHEELEDEFTMQVIQFLETLKKSRFDEDLRSLSTRLDYNDFYSRFE